MWSLTPKCTLTQQLLFLEFFYNFDEDRTRAKTSVTLTAQTGILEYINNIKNVVTNKTPKLQEVTHLYIYFFVSVFILKKLRDEIVRGDTEDTADVLEAFDGGQGSCLGFTCLDDQLLQTQCKGRNFFLFFLFSVFLFYLILICK